MAGDEALAACGGVLVAFSQGKGWWLAGTLFGGVESGGSRATSAPGHEAWRSRDGAPRSCKRLSVDVACRGTWAGGTSHQNEWQL